MASSSLAEDIPKWKLARQGMNLLINNKPNEAEALFKKYPDSLEMYAGYSFGVFMDALMGFEEDKLSLAIATLKNTEHKCNAENGWIKSVKSRVFGTSESPTNEVENLERQIILADSQVCLAVLLFLQQDFSGYFKGGWILRKSWKLYQHAYNEIRNVYVHCVGDLPGDHVILPAEGAASEIDDPVSLACLTPTNGYIQHSRPPKMSHSYSTEFNGSGKRSNLALKKSTSAHSALTTRLAKNGVFSSFPSFSHSMSFSSFTAAFDIFPMEKGKLTSIDKETITRLMGAVAFGYGLFNLGISLLPPPLLKFSNFFGFNGNRSIGIDSLMFARLGVDMRAPLASLTLLWYHTIVRPFYAIDGSNLQAGVEASIQLLNEVSQLYSDSALVLFFNGRTHRLQSKIPEALDSFQASLANTTHREIRILSLHEIGWCYLIQLEYSAAENTFRILRSTSRWSRAFYAYLELICAGSGNNLGDPVRVRELKSFFENMPKGSQLEVLLLRRYKCCTTIISEIGVRKDAKFWKMFVYELMYLWNTLPNCNGADVRSIIADCESITESSTMEPMLGISKLIQGYCYSLLRDFDSSILSFKKCLEMRKNHSHNADDSHVSAFAEYELGTILLKTSQTREEGKALLQHVSFYKDYDFEERLAMRIHAILKV